MRYQDEILEQVKNETKAETVNNKTIYFNYETPDEVAYVEIIDDNTCITLDCYMYDRINTKLIRSMYPEFF